MLPIHSGKLYVPQILQPQFAPLMDADSPDVATPVMWWLPIRARHGHSSRISQQRSSILHSLRDRVLFVLVCASMLLGLKHMQLHMRSQPTELPTPHRQQALPRAELTETIAVPEPEQTSSHPPPTIPAPAPIPAPIASERSSPPDEREREPLPPPPPEPPRTMDVYLNRKTGVYHTPECHFVRYMHSHQDEPSNLELRSLTAEELQRGTMMIDGSERRVRPCQHCHKKHTPNPQPAKKPTYRA